MWLLSGGMWEALRSMRGLDLPLTFAQIGLPDPGPITGMVCGAFHSLHDLAGPVLVVMLALNLLLAIAFGEGSWQPASLVVAVLIALAVNGIDQILTALGAGGGCP